MHCISKLKEGDEEVFNEVYTEYYQQLYSYIRSKTCSDYYAEEVLQLAFIKLWRFRKHLSEDISLKIQLYRIAKTSLIDVLRSAENKEKAYKEFSVVKHRENLAVENRDIEQKEIYSKIRKILTSLPPIRKKVFEMSRFKEMSHREISDQLNIAPKTVENHINLALKYLKAVFVLLIWICFV